MTRQTLSDAALATGPFRTASDSGPNGGTGTDYLSMWNCGWASHAAKKVWSATWM